MSRIKPQKEEAVKRISYTPEELKKVIAETNGDFSYENELAFFLKRKAIKIRMSTNLFGHKIRDVHVIQYADGSIPYPDVQNLWEAAKSYHHRSTRADAANLEHLDSIRDHIPDKSIQATLPMI